MDGEMSRDVGLTAKEEMERVIKGTVDRLFNELKTRSVRLMEIDEKFGFLLDMEGLYFNTEINHLKDQFKNLAKSTVLMWMDENCTKKFWTVECCLLAVRKIYQVPSNYLCL